MKTIKTSVAIYAVVFSVFLFPIHSLTYATEPNLFSEQFANLNSNQKNSIYIILESKPNKNLVISPGLLEYRNNKTWIVIEDFGEYFLVQELSRQGELIVETELSKSSIIGNKISCYFEINYQI
jgi:hypothetical protein